MKAFTSLAVLACVVGTACAADPHEPDTAADCFQWIQAIAGDDCNSLAQADNVKIDEFLLWNPTLKKSCNAVKVDYYYCTGSKQTGGGGKPTTTTTVVPPTPTLDVGLFPTSGGEKQCVSNGKPIPNPKSITAGRVLLTAISSACSKLVGEHKWLEKGLPYTTSVKVGDHDTTFAVQIKLGGFDVINSKCTDQLKVVLNTCTKTGNTFGGCAYTSDFNMLACIFP